jgi:hypothetical protein
MFKKDDILLCRFGGDGNYFIAKYEDYQDGRYWCVVKYIAHVKVNQKRDIIESYNDVSDITKGKIYELTDREIITKIESTDELLVKLM